jgi:TetR/AcrR family transcriptional regulator, transcriptional repressor for nem operon
MRRSREDAAQTRRSIVETASRLFRSRGIASVSVADIMGALELTVGGFYRHFESKEALVSEAIDAASLETSAPPSRAKSLLDTYLSKAHRDHPERGCPVPALCSEVAHEGPLARHAFTKSLRRLLDTIATVVPGASQRASDRRLQTAASLVGAIVLARATDDDALADDVLAAVRRGLEVRAVAGRSTQS